MTMKFILNDRRRRLQLTMAGACLFSVLSTPASANEPVGADEAPIPVIPGGIVITGSRSERLLDDATVATEVISRRDIEASGAETVADLLEEHPGVDISRSFRGAGLRLQGLDEKHVLILMDGERTGGRIGGALDLSRLPVSAIERVEIVKGPSSALYGSEAMGGVINIITRGARKAREAELQTALGTDGIVDVSSRVGFRTQNWNLRSFVGWHKIDAYDLNPDDIATTGSGHRMGHFSKRTEYQMSETLKLVSRASYLQRDQKGIDANSVGAIFDRRNLTENAAVSLEPSFRFAKNHHLKLSASYRFFRDQYVYDQRQSSTQDKDQETREQLTQISVQYLRSLSPQHRLTIGSDTFFERLETVRLLGGVGQRYRAALYVQDEWSPNTSNPSVWRFVPGYRLDVDSEFGTQNTPKFALRYRPSRRLKLRASYGMGFRSPDFKELFLFFENPSRGYVVEGNPELGAETSHSVNTSLDLIVNRSLWFFINFYHNEIDNLINTQPLPMNGTVGVQRYTYVNIDSVYTQGLDARTRTRLGRDLILEAGYSLTNAQDRSLKRPLNGRARHRATFDLRFRYRPAMLRLTARGSVVGQHPFYDDASPDEPARQAPSYARVDLRAAKKWGKTWRIFATIENLLDSGDSFFLPIQPRTFSAGFSARL